MLTDENGVLWCLLYDVTSHFYKNLMFSPRPFIAEHTFWLEQERGVCGALSEIVILNP